MTGVTRVQAENACHHLKERLRGMGGIQGIGIAVLDNGYGLKVNLRDSVTGPIPSEIDGVPVIVDVVGIIAPW